MRAGLRVESGESAGSCSKTAKPSGVVRTLPLPRWRGWQQSINSIDPDGPRLIERQAMLLAHPRPALMVGQCLERDQHVPALLGRQRRQLGLVHQFEAD